MTWRARTVTVLLVLALAALLTGATALYFGKTARLDLINYGTAVAIGLFLLGVSFWGPLSFAHANRLSQDAGLPTPATFNFNLRALGLLTMLAAVLWLGIIIGTDLCLQ
jgi:hypothetical protein